MQSTTALLIIIAVMPCFCQRPFYAGLRPIGYPETPVTLNLDDRFAANLPPQLNGDVAYANRLDQLPIDQQPIWYLNQKQHEDALRNPQIYPQRPSSFNENSG